MEKPARRKTPYQKKQDEYDKDRFGDKESPHRFRRAKPKKKKGVNRQERSRTRDLVRKALLENSEENLSGAALKKVADPIYSFPWKGAVTLREILTRKADRHNNREQFLHYKKQKAAKIRGANDV